MERRELLLQMRKDKTLKGLKPAFVTLKLNTGKIYTGGTSNFILSLKNNILYFQKITLFLKKLKPKEDFEINAKRFTEYTLETRGYTKILYLFDKAGYFLEIRYLYGTKQTAPSDDNISRIIAELKETINLVEANNDGTEEE